MFMYYNKIFMLILKGLLNYNIVIFETGEII